MLAKYSKGGSYGGGGRFFDAAVLRGGGLPGEGVRDVSVA